MGIPSARAAIQKRAKARRAAVPGLCLVALAMLVALSTPADAATVSSSGGNITYAAGAGETNALSVDVAGANVTLVDDAAVTIVAGAGCVAAANSATCPLAGVGSLAVDLGDQSDSVTANVPFATSLIGGPGDDTLEGGPASDTFVGGSGSDTYVGNGSSLDIADYSARAARVTVDPNVAGGDGEPGEDDDVGADVEWILGGSGNDDLKVSDQAVGGGGLFGGNGNDTLTGNGHNSLLGGEGDDDTFSAPFGSDVFVGGSGVDTVDYSTRSNPLRLEARTGTLSGEAGENDRIHSDIEKLIGGSDNDFFSGSTIDNSFIGGDGSDTVSYETRATPITADLASGGGQGGENDDYSSIENIVGGSNDDTLTGDAGDNVLNGGEGDDTLAGGLGEDAASYEGHGAAVEADLGAGTGGASGETDTYSSIEDLIGGTLNDTLTGDAQDNRLDGGPGDDQLNGAGGSDTASYATRDTGVVAGLPDGGGEPGEVDSFDSIENLLGGGGNDVLKGDQAANTISGGPGDDQVDGGDGPDSMSGGSGTDTIDYSARTVPVTIDLNGLPDDGEAGERDNVASDFETLAGGAASDLLLGGASNETLQGNRGDDLLDGRGGADLLLGGDGNDTVSYLARTSAVSATPDGAADDGEAGEGDNVGSDVENALGGSGNDYLAGGPGSNALVGGAGADLLLGLDGFDYLGGGDGADTLFGGEANDLLAGGAGNDALAGEGGSDVLAGETGDDLLDGGAGADTFDGGPGADTADYSLRTAPVNVSFDRTANDGGAGEADNVRGDVEGIVTGSAGDTIDSRDGIPSSVACGAGLDAVVADGADTVAPDCENVTVVAAAVARASISSTSLKMARKGRVKVRIACEPTRIKCQGKLTLRSRSKVRQRRHKKRKRLKVGARKFSIPAGKTSTVTIKASKSAQRYLTKRRSLKVRQSLNLTGAGSASRNATLKGPKKGKR